MVIYIFTMPPRKSKQNRQTRLNFAPLPSSSPSSGTYPKEVQSRLANVRYETPSRSRRKMGPSDPEAASVPPGKGVTDSIVIGSSPQDTTTHETYSVMDPSIPRDRNQSHSLPTPINSSQQKEEDLEHGNWLMSSSYPNKLKLTLSR